MLTLIVIFFLIVSVGTFYNLGKARSKFEGYFWAILSLLLWITTNYFTSKIDVSSAVFKLIIVLLFQFLLAGIEYYYSKRVSNNKYNVSFGNIDFDFSTKTIKIQYHIIDQNNKSLNISLVNSQDKMEFVTFISEYSIGNNDFFIDATALLTGSYTLKINQKNKLIDSKMFYYNSNLGIRLL
ncbi:MAG: hypothetical protein JXR48_03215 [Candidatus Delongbacteria bacterium]|nr:hypothetical protein [Candidatus Delongbacteria bacterium]MBN2833957.1 hypothetical protein [Candidatus Delongbacteria bacterium]